MVGRKSLRVTTEFNRSKSNPLLKSGIPLLCCQQLTHIRYVQMCGEIISRTLVTYCYGFVCPTVCLKSLVDKLTHGYNKI